MKKPVPLFNKILVFLLRRIHTVSLAGGYWPTDELRAHKTCVKMHDMFIRSISAIKNYSFAVLLTADFNRRVIKKNQGL